jgi:hypothetical protein
MGTPDHAKARAIGAYNAAADHYGDPANAFWDRFGRRTASGTDSASATSNVALVTSWRGARRTTRDHHVGPSLVRAGEHALLELGSRTPARLEAAIGGRSNNWMQKVVSGSGETISPSCVTKA